MERLAGRAAGIDGGKGTALIFRFDAYELDDLQCELRQHGQLVPLEPQVFDLLLCLLRNRHRLVTHDELFDDVWQGRAVSEAALSTRLNAVRRAIGDNGRDQRLIRTLRRRGFRFIAPVREVHARAGQDEDQPAGSPS
jgi:DNA-binding winged helix-turn-helix (wHTH) protein